MLTRISHKKPTAMENMAFAAALHSLSLLDVLQVRLRRLRSSTRNFCINCRLYHFVTISCEKCGLSFFNTTD
jgi:hypothetical protein